MITTNSDGQPISAGFAEALSEGIVWYDVRLFDGGREVDCKIVRLALSLGSTADSGDAAGGVPLGSVSSAAMTASLVDCQQAVLGHELEVRVGVLVGESYEYVTVALVTVTGAWTAAGVTQVEAVGRISALMSGAPCGLAGGTYASSAVSSAIQQASGVTVTLGAFAGTSGVLVPIAEGSTCRAALSALALACGGYAAETNDGTVLVAPLPTGGHTTALGTDIMPSLPQLSDAQCTIDGLTVTVPSDDPETTDATWTFGTGRIAVELPGATQASAAALWDNVRGATWRPGSATVAVLDPRITPFDVAEVTLDEVTREVPTWGIQADYDGGYFGTVSAQGFTEAADDATIAGPLQTAVGEARAASTAAMAASALAEEKAAQAVADAATASRAATAATTAASAATTAASQATTAAGEAKQDALAASTAAQSALLGLSTVQDVVSVLQWLSEHGHATDDATVDPSTKYYVRDDDAEIVRLVTEPDATLTPQGQGWRELVTTTDAEVAEGKVYYELDSGTGLPVAVSSPTGDPSAQGWYELPVTADASVVSDKSYYEVATDGTVSLVTDTTTPLTPVGQGWWELDEAVTQYLAAHLALTDHGLNLKVDGHEGYIHLGTLDGSHEYGTYIVGGDGVPAANFGEHTRIGRSDGMHVDITSDSQASGGRLFSIADGTSDPVMYVQVVDGESTVYMTNAVVVRDLRFGDWMWYERPNGNMSVRWVGDDA